MKNKKLLIVCLITLLFASVVLVPGIVVLSMSEDSPVKITYSGEETKILLINRDDKKQLKAEASLDGELTYQWEIMANLPGSEWVEINGMTEQDCDVTLALVRNVLSATYETKLRCSVSDGTETYLSEEVRILVNYDSASSYSSKKTASLSPKASAAPINDGINEIYSITINYIYKSGEIARESNVLSIESGTPVHHIIPIPPNIGYIPELQDSYPGVEIVPVVDEEGNETETLGVKIDFESLDEPRIINVVYMPDLVNFVVHHHRQNLLDDNYESEPFMSVPMQGYTGEPVGDCHLDIDGFHALYYERMQVAADGSTQVEIYYDRDYYLVSFDLFGGFGVEPIYTRYGSEIGVNTPTRPGYVFTGWTLLSVNGRAPTADEINEYLFTDNHKTVTIGASLSYIAKWEKGSTTYTMAFWRENANDDGYSYWGSVVIDSHSNGNDLMVGDIVDAEDWVSRVSYIDDEQYFTYNPARSDHDIELKGDGSTVVNAYYTRNRYTITFKANGICAIEEKHTHSSDCYIDVCGRQHIHDESCVYDRVCGITEHLEHDADCKICGMDEHTHGVDCPGVYSCGKNEHTHSSECCTVDIHVHTKSCYPNVGTEVSQPATSGHPNYHTFPTGDKVVNGYIARFKKGNQTYHYIHIDGKWYNYTKTANDGTVIQPTSCKATVHDHTSGCVYCSTEAHTHSGDCVACGNKEHTHTSSCYKDVIHTHTEECYDYPYCEEHIHEDECMLLVCAMPTGHSHTTTCDQSSRESTVKLVTRKYQESLSDIWPIVDENNVVYDQGQRWSPADSSYYSQVLVYIADMPADDFSLTVNVSSYKTFIMHYMLEVLPGEEYDVTYNGKKFVESFEVRANYNHITKAEDFFDIKGFTQYGSNPSFSSDGKISQNGGDVYFYYKRNTGEDIKIEFTNVNSVVKSYYGDDLMYGLPLYDYQYNNDGTLFVPDYPDVYEKNAYKFDQWYTTPECIPGTEADWDALTMPDGVMSLYAHWVPVKHTVRIFKDATLSEQLGDTIEVDHGTLLADPGHPTNGQLIFSGWFYKDDNGVEKAFVFNGIPVKDSIDIYAKWGSRVAVQYTIYYKILNSDGTETEIATSTVGSTIAGQNRTFDAKGGLDLYESYREGYFPMTSNHSIIMSAEVANEYTFYYLKKDTVGYTVRYLDASGNPLAEDKVVSDNKLAIVTETFVPVSGYMPDSYQKRLVVSANEEENVLVFHYTKDEVHAFYRVVHYWQNLDGLTYAEHSYVDIKATVGTVCAAKPISITGFDFKEAKLDGENIELDFNGNVRATLDSDGMLIAFYYDRQVVEYTVDYVEYGNTSNHIVESSEPKYGLYGATVEERALDLTNLGYTRVSDATLRITLKTSNNKIVFSYQENTVNYRFVAIMGDTVNNAYYSENILARTGTAQGCTPIASTDYTFAGWFADEACTIQLDPKVHPVEILEGDKLVPKKSDSNGDGVYLFEGGVYYAKFNYNFSSLTITVTDSPDSEQAHLFVVEGVSGGASESYRTTVVIIGNGSVTIDYMKVGNYKVTEVDDWSWRYDVSDGASKEVRVFGQNGVNVVFKQSQTNDKWLDGNGSTQIIIP